MPKFQNKQYLIRKFLEERHFLEGPEASFACLGCRWVSQPALRARLSGPCLVRHPMSPNALVALPADFSELINEASLFRCPNSDGDDSRSPTLCLVCGRLLCSQSYCCQVCFSPFGPSGLATLELKYLLN